MAKTGMKTSFLDSTSWVEISNLLFGSHPLWVQRCLLWGPKNPYTPPTSLLILISLWFLFFRWCGREGISEPLYPTLCLHFIVALLECIMVSNKKNRKFISFKKWNKCCSGIRCVTIGGWGRETDDPSLTWMTFYLRYSKPYASLSLFVSRASR